jgi:F0F1-type ATP synthase epsilon subunit
MATRQEASTGDIVDDGRPVALNKTEKLTMHVKVYSPFKVYFNQNAYSVSGENATGPFDILPHHHNFISLLKPCDLVLRTEAGEPKVKIGGGIMYVKADEVTVFLDV